MQKKLKSNGSMMTSRNNTKKDVVFIIGDWNAKVGSQEIPGLTVNFGLGVQNEVLTEICQDNTLGTDEGGQTERGWGLQARTSTLTPNERGGF